MDRNSVEQLLIKYNAGLCSAEEVVLIETWYYLEQANKEITLSPDRFKELDAKMSFEFKKRYKPKTAYFSWISVAAAVLIITGFYYVFHKTESSPKRVTYYASNVQSGINKATLTLADGRKVILSDVADGQIVKETGVTITKSANGQLVYVSNPTQVNAAEAQGKKPGLSYNTLSTAKGEQYTIVLPDGTKLCLNAASSLKFPITFAGASQRKVELSGEAYFEVSKDKDHPFVVKSSTQEVKVLGTHFNINSYPDEPNVKTTLLEGSVLVTPSSSLRGNETAEQKPENETLKKLQPGEQSTNTNGAITITKVDAEAVVAWKDGDFNFKNEAIESVMRKVARWYDVEVTYEDLQAVKTFSITGTLKKNKKVSDLLIALEQTGDVHFKIEGRRITVMK